MHKKLKQVRKKLEQKSDLFSFVHHCNKSRYAHTRCALKHPGKRLAETQELHWFSIKI